jgi:hypothetical protein
MITRDLFTDLVIVFNSMAALAGLLTGSFTYAILFGLNACIMFQYRVSKEK